MATDDDERRRTYPLRVEQWDEIPRLVHGFLGREHGLPPGPFTLDDVRDALVRAGESPTLVAAADQVHGAVVLGPEDVGEAERPSGDAWVSASADLLLTIRTADCVPILLLAPRARAVAAVHAGWRGLLAGVIEASLAELAARYAARPDEVEVAIGPAIGGCCYAFGVEHRDAFVTRLGADAAAAWRPDPNDPALHFLDLRGLCRLALERAGVDPGAITTIGPCTADHPDELHSFRRDGAHAGRQLSYIGWRA